MTFVLRVSGPVLSMNPLHWKLLASAKQIKTASVAERAELRPTFGRMSIGGPSTSNRRSAFVCAPELHLKMTAARFLFPGPTIRSKWMAYTESIA